MSRTTNMKMGTKGRPKISKETFLMGSAFAAALMVSAFSVTGTANAGPQSSQPAAQHMVQGPVEPIENRMITVTAEVAYDYDMIEPETAALTSFSLPVYFADGDERLTPEAEIAIAAFADEALMNGAMHMSVMANKAPHTRAAQILASARAENILISLNELGMPERLLALDNFHADAPVITAGLN